MILALVCRSPSISSLNLEVSAEKSVLMASMTGPRSWNFFANFSNCCPVVSYYGTINKRRRGEKGREEKREGERGGEGEGERVGEKGGEAGEGYRVQLELHDLILQRNQEFGF